MKGEKVKILIYGYGNPGRKDDGLGPALADQVEKWIFENNFCNVKVDTNYQLNIEDAYSIRNYDIVIFADASIEQLEDFALTLVHPSDKTEFTMHSVDPAFVLDLCQKIYGSAPLVYLLHIKGYEFQLEEGLTKKACKNLRKSFEFIKSVLKRPGFLLSYFEKELMLNKMPEN